MKKSTSQIFVAVVCALLGFLLAYQFKALTGKGDAEGQNIDKSNIIAEVEGLKKEKDVLVKTNGELTEKLKNLEESVAKNGQLDSEIKKQLDNSRMVLGTEDVTGPGAKIILSPKSDIFAGNNETVALSEQELVHLVNILWFSGAQAVSVNGYRITPQTGIKQSSDYLWIGNAGKLNPRDKVEIKVIGDKNRLKVSLDWPGTLDYNKLRNFKSEVVYSDDIVIEKTSESLKSDQLHPVKKKE